MLLSVGWFPIVGAMLGVFVSLFWPGVGVLVVVVGIVISCIVVLTSEVACLS